MIVLRCLKDKNLPLQGTAVALGMFDGVHRGHQEVLGAAEKLARKHRLIPCAFTFALAEPRPNFKKRPILTDASMLAYLLEQQGMDYVLAPSFDQMKDLSPEEYVGQVLGKTLGAKVLCCGENFTFAKGGQAGTQDLQRIGKEMGMEVHVLPLLARDGQTVSSTRIRGLIEAGDMEAAAVLLGRYFNICFPVVQGNRIGRTLGTPTINQPFPADFVIPRFGVYATVAQVNGVRYSGVTNVGIKPTVGSDIPLAETYIQGFSGDLYGQEVQVAFLQFIRPEQKFASLDELRENIYRDAKTADAIAQKHIQNTL